MYLLRCAGGLPAQEELWGYLIDGIAMLHPTDPQEWNRIRELMRQYHDTPMDFADASLVSAAEHLGLQQIFSIDSHFHVFRIHGERAFNVVP